MGLERVKQLLNPCALCGACFGRGPEVPHNWRVINPIPAPVRRCPSLEYFKFRTFTAMDRITLATLVEREDYPITDEFKKVIYSCTMCGVCSEICGMFDPVDIMLAAREEVAERATLLPVHKTLIENFKTYGNPLRKPDSGKGKWAQNLGIKDIIREKAENLFYVGCAIALRPGLSKIAEKTANLFKQAGVDFGILGGEEKCCGYLPKMIGDRGLYEKQAADNIKLFNSLGVKRVITACPECLATIKSYPREARNFEVIHSVQLIDQLIKEGKLKLVKEVKAKVTFHDPCNLSRFARVIDPPRDILSAIPGIEYVEMKRHGKWSYCCGAGGGARYVSPDFATFTAKERIKEARETGAQILATACPQCYTFLKGISKDNKNSMRVEDILVLVSEALEPYRQ